MFNKTLRRPMFRRGGSTSEGTGLMSMVEPRKGFKDGPKPNYKVLDGPVDYSAIKVGGAGLPPLTRDEIADKLYGGQPISKPSKAELALLIGRLASEPGNLYEKFKAGNPLISKIIAGQREAEAKRSETIGSVLTKSALDERMQTIKAADPGQQQKDALSMFNSLTKGLQRIEKDGQIYYLNEKTGEAIPQIHFERQALNIALRTPGFLSTNVYREKLRRDFEKDKEMSKLQINIGKADTALRNLEKQYAEKPTKELKKNIEKKTQDLGNKRVTYDKFKKEMIEDKLAIEGLIKIDPTQPVVPVEEKADGGRMGYAYGTTPTPMARSYAQPSVQPTTVPTNQAAAPGAKKVSRQQIRDSLPPEIGEDVVDLLASNTNALYEFANIQTSEDLVAFNKKYGTNVNLPQSA